MVDEIEYIDRAMGVDKSVKIRVQLPGPENFESRLRAIDHLGDDIYNQLIAIERIANDRYFIKKCGPRYVQLLNLFADVKKEAKRIKDHSKKANQIHATRISGYGDVINKMQFEIEQFINEVEKSDEILAVKNVEIENLKKQIENLKDLHRVKSSRRIKRK